MRKRFIILGEVLLLTVSMIIPVKGETYTYDNLNRVTKVVYDDGSYLTYEYDANGNIKKTEKFEMENNEDLKENEDNKDDNKYDKEQGAENGSGSTIKEKEEKQKYENKKAKYLLVKTKEGAYNVTF